jgi:hypothetical protein
MMVRFDNVDPSGGLLTYVTGVVNQQLLLRQEYLLAKNRIVQAHLPTVFF